MRAFKFIHEICKKFPVLLGANTLLLLAVGISSALSLFAVGPIVDLFMHPDLQGISPLTGKAVYILTFLGYPRTLGNWLVVFLVFVIASGLFQVFAMHSILKTKYAVVRDMMVGAFEDFFNARWHFFTANTQGVLLNTFSRELTVVGDAFGAMAMFFSHILQLVFYLAVPLCISWPVTVISLASAVLFSLPFIMAGRLSYRFGKANTATANALMSAVQESVSLAKVVLGFGNQDKNARKVGEAFDAHRRATLRSQVLNISIPLLYRPLGIVALVIALIAARRFGVPLSEVTVMLFALLQVASTIGSLATEKNSVENFFPSYEQVNALRGRARELVQISGAVPFTGFSRELTVEGLSFAYPNHEEPVLTDVNIRIPKGSMIAFVGESGAGKSTLIDIIMGFHEPSAGRVALDGRPLSDIDIRTYRQRIGYVPQESALFNMTIRDNLLWASGSATEDQIAHACRQANADEFIRQLPGGYNTVVGDRGVRLSGGQVQRVALARAILRRPELLILDEATSALDTSSERLIQEAIEAISRETTIAVIAHRLSTIVNADYIYVLKKGRVVEEGSYTDLVRANGYFNRMVKLQLLETV
ncbi:MAG: ABC transporter ATP-binding protein [Candidatus Omnitrophota bacterium]